MATWQESLKMTKILDRWTQLAGEGGRSDMEVFYCVIGIQDN